jgi:hypothetical protein
MSFGLKIFTPSGSTCIDGDFKSYMVWQSGYSPPNTFLSFPRLSVQPLIFIRPVAYGRTFGISSRGFNILQTNDSSGDSANILYRIGECNYVLAIPMTGTSGESSGIRVFNNSGEVAFDSGKSYINIDSVVMRTTNTLAEAGTWSQTITYPTVPVGQRYFLLDTVGLLDYRYGFYSDPGDGTPGQDYYLQSELIGTFNSETSVTFTISQGYTTGSSFVQGQGFDNPGIPLISAYINL